MLTAAIFDLDGTLIPPPSAEWRLLWQLWRTGTLPAAGLAECLGRSGLQWFTNGPRSFTREYLRAVPGGALMKAVASLAREVAAALPRPAREIIHQHRRAGHALVLLTGTPGVLAEAIAGGLEFDCARGDCTPPVRTLALIEASPKVRALHDLCGARRWRAGDCYAYADSDTDVPLLKAVGHPTAVNPDRALLQHALHLGWPVLQW